MCHTVASGLSSYQLLECELWMSAVQCNCSQLHVCALQADVLTAQQIEEAEQHMVTITGLCSVQANKAVLQAMQVGTDSCPRLNKGGKPA